MKKTKKLLTWALCLLLACGVAGSALAAFAAYKTTELSGEGLLYQGVLNELSWSATGRGTSNIKAKKENSYLKGVNAGTDCYVSSYTPLNLANGDVRFSFDVLRVYETTPNVAPLIGSALKSWEGTKIGTVQPLGLLALGGGGISPANTVNGSDPVVMYLSEAQDATAYEITNGWGWVHNVFGDFSASKGGKLTYEFRADGTCCIYRDVDGRDRTTWDELYIKNVLNAEAIQGDLYFGSLFYCTGGLDIDNLKLEQKNAQGEWVVKDSTDCEGAWNSANQTAQDGKWFVEGGRKVVGAKLDFENPDESDRLVLKEKIKVDETCDRVFTLSASAKFTTLTKNFGLLMGTESETAALTSGSFVYFHNVTDGDPAVTTTHVALNTTDVDLGVNLADDAFHTLTVETFTKDGTVIVTVDGDTEHRATFTGASFAGYLAFAASGEGDATVSLEPNVSVVNYAYRGSEGGAQATNFNTGFIDEDKWAVQNVTAISGVDDPREVVGIEVTDDGKLYFHGVGNYCYFSSVDRYADYVLEVDYITPASYPAVTGNGGNPQQGSVCIGANEHSAYVNAHMFNMFDYSFGNYLNYQNKKDATESEISVQNATYKFGCAGETDEAKKHETVTAMKFVVLNNTITVYAQDITETAFDKDNYKKLTEVTVADTFGYVSLLSADPGFAKFDNLRITPIDDPDAAKRAEKLEAFVDRVAIEDEYVTLAAPEAVANGATVSWNNVKYAEGYIVTVNGTAQAQQALNTFTVTGDPGEYKITVQAVSSKGYATNSAQSAEITVTLTDSGNNNQGGNQGGNGNQGGATEEPEEKGCGCGGSVAAAGTLSLAAAVLVLALGAVLLRKKKTNK